MSVIEKVKTTKACQGRANNQLMITYCMSIMTLTSVGSKRKHTPQQLNCHGDMMPWASRVAQKTPCSQRTQH